MNRRLLFKSAIIPTESEKCKDESEGPQGRGSRVCGVAALRYYDSGPEKPRNGTPLQASPGYANPQSRRNLSIPCISANVS